MNKLLITGSPGSGKSSLIRRLILESGRIPAGFQTVRRQGDGFWGYWMEALPACKKSAQISIVYPGKAPAGMIDSFEGFGCRCLEEALETGAELIVMDEIGRFETGALKFQETVHRVLDSDRTVLAVLKKEKIPFHKGLKEKPGTVLIDLNEWGREQAYRQAMKQLNQKIGMKGEL